MGQNISIYPYPRKDRIDKEGMAPLMIRFDINNKPVAYENIHKKIPIKSWDEASRRVSNDYPNAIYINAIIDKKLVKHREFILKREAFDLPITAALLKQYASNGSEFTFQQYAEKVIKEKKLDDGHGYSEDTKRRYRDEVKRISIYQPVLQLSHITDTWLSNYRGWLTTEYKKKDGKNLSKNSVWKALSFVQMVYNEAIKAKLILAESSPFTSFSVGSYEKSDKLKYLEISEVDQIEATLLSRPDLPEMTIKIGWRFLAMCVSGMRISDAMRLNEGFFNENGDLIFSPLKTRRHGNIATVPITTDRQRRYFARTLQDEFPETNPKNFRTTFNNHLKVILAAAGVRLDIRSHSGRHTMGGLLVDAGIETKSKMAIMGVKSEKTLSVYDHLKEDKLEKEARKLNGAM